jgi:leucyl-tRNA synthetase
LGGLGWQPPAGTVEQKLHATIAKVTEDIGALRYNTAIAAMMEYLNVLREGNRPVNRAEVEPLVVLVAPFAPHIAEELWQHLGHPGSMIDAAPWPSWDPAKAIADSVEFVVQVNGKLRARIDMPRGIAQADAQAAAMADENVRKYTDGAAIRKVVFVQDRLLNLVVG